MKGKNPEHAVFSPDMKWLYVSAEEADRVDVVDLAKGEVVKSVVVGDRPRGIGFLPDGTRAYVAAENADTVNVFDVATHEVVARIKAGARSNGVPCIGRQAGVRDLGRRRHVQVIGHRDQRDIAKVPVGRRPWNMALTPDGNKLYVACGRVERGRGRRHAHARESGRDPGRHVALGRGDPVIRRVAARALALAAAVACPAACAEPRASRFRTRASDVVAPAPLPGPRHPALDGPQATSSVRPARPRARAEDDVARFLGRNATGAVLENAQGNPVPAGPPLSAASSRRPCSARRKGVSVFQDGVRHQRAVRRRRELGRDPMRAIAGSSSCPGRIRLRPQHARRSDLAADQARRRYRRRLGRVIGGSFGRRQVAVEAGGAVARPRRVRRREPDRRRRLGRSQPEPRATGVRAGRLPRRRDDASLSFTGADNRLAGSQTIPTEWLDAPRAAYTWPDENRNRLAFLNGTLLRRLAPETTLTVNLYARRTTTRNVSSNVNDDFDDAGEPQAFNDRTSIAQIAGGVAMQLALERDGIGGRHRVTLGASLTRAASTSRRTRNLRRSRPSAAPCRSANSRPRRTPARAIATSASTPPTRSSFPTPGH
jgi:YVTN family beta-propeller protein